MASRYRRRLQRRIGPAHRRIRSFHSRSRGATIAPEDHQSSAEAEHSEPTYWATAVEESELLSADGVDHDQAAFLDCRTTPVLDQQRSVEVLVRTNRALLVLFSDQWRLAAIEREHPHLRLDKLFAATN